MTKKKQPDVRLKIDRLDIRISIDGTLYDIAELVKQREERREADERSRKLYQENENLKAVNAGLQATLDSYESDIAR